MNAQPVLLFCDDDPVRGQRWANLVEGMPGIDRFKIETLTGKGLAYAIEALNVRRESARKGDTPPECDLADSFDSADIAVIDYDLTPDQQVLNRLSSQNEATDVQARLRARTGESVAYLARNFSTAGFLVIVNQRFQEATFDITLQRFAESSADLNISQADLSNPALWSGATPTPGSFHPWSWPVLARADELWNRRLAATDLSKPVLSSLGLDGDRFSARQEDLLGEVAHDRELNQVVFNDLVESSLGLDVKDVQNDPERRSAIAASVVGRWVEHLVLPGQNVIADLPHLLSRFPSLLGSGAGNLDVWNRLADKSLASAPPQLGQHEQLHGAFTSRLSWTVSSARSAAAGVADPEEVADVAFCEDTSRFVDLLDAQEVETDVAGPNSRRFIELLSSVRYEPLRRVL